MLGHLFTNARQQSRTTAMVTNSMIMALGCLSGGASRVAPQVDKPSIIRHPHYWGRTPVNWRLVRNAAR